MARGVSFRTDHPRFAEILADPYSAGDTACFYCGKKSTHFIAYANPTLNELWFVDLCSNGRYCIDYEKNTPTKAIPRDKWKLEVKLQVIVHKR